MNAYFDIGERPLQPPEADVTDRELDAMRARWTAETEELAADDQWWGEMAESDFRVRRDLYIAASLLMQDHPIAARYTLEYTINRVVDEREREELSNAD